MKEDSMESYVMQYAAGSLVPSAVQRRRNGVGVLCNTPRASLWAKEAQIN